MRTTVDIDDDVLAAVKELARAEGKSMGTIMSDLVRRALTQPSGPGFGEAQAAYVVDTWAMLPDRPGPPVTNELIRRIQDELDLEDATPFDFEKNAPRTFKD